MLLNPVVSSGTNRHGAITLPLLIFCFQVLAIFTPWIIDWHLKLFACVMQHATIWLSNAPLHMSGSLLERILHLYILMHPGFCWITTDPPPPPPPPPLLKCCSSAPFKHLALSKECEARARWNTLFSAERPANASISISFRQSSHCENLFLFSFVN